MTTTIHWQTGTPPIGEAVLGWYEETQFDFLVFEPAWYGDEPGMPQPEPEWDFAGGTRGYRPERVFAWAPIPEPPTMRSDV
jgi:hypothetical protein